MNPTFQNSVILSTALALLLVSSACASIDPVDLADTVDTPDAAKQDVGRTDINTTNTTHDTQIPKDVTELHDTAPTNDTELPHDAVLIQDTAPPKDTEEAPSPCQPGKVDTEGICDIWVLRGHKNQWEGYPRTFATPGAAAPQGTIRAAFDIEHHNLAFVLTDTTMYELNPILLTWKGSRPLSDFSPALGSGMSPRMAYGVAPLNTSENEHISVMSVQGNTARRWDRFYSPSTDKILLATFPGASDGDVHSWNDANAPPVSMITAGWMDRGNLRGIMPGSPRAFCNKGGDRFGPYVAVMTSLHIHFADVGYFCGFTQPVPLSQVAILQLAGAPPTTNIGAAFWHQGDLFIFAAD